jgi:YbbR domain-containing protein
MSFRNLILKDFWLKLCSFALAVLVWFTVSVAIRNEIVQSNNLLTPPPRTFSLRVNLLSAAADLRGLRASPELVEVTVRSESADPATLQAKDIHVFADLTGVTPARNLRRRLEVSAPPGVQVIRVIPADVEIIVPASPTP